MRGRPKGSGSKYDPKYCAMIVEYFENLANADDREHLTVTVQETKTEDLQAGEKIRSEKTGYLKREVRRICAELPTIEGFAISIKIPSPTVRLWAKDHEEFAASYARAKDIQRQLLVDRGLTRQYDPQAFAFVAKNITDMTDKQVLAGDPDAPLAAKLVLVDAGQPEPKR